MWNLNVALLFLDSLQILEIHINLLRPINAPFVLSRPLHDILASHWIPKSGPVPWINTNVIITQQHAMKGHRAVVLDVLCNQKTPSGLRVHIHLTAYDPTSPFRCETSDYNGVVE